jgi:AcrR family transcriptional regulator
MELRMPDPSDPQPRRGYHHGDLRDALLSAGAAELRDKGIEGFTLRSCAKRAGVSHGAPAHHFADANALLTALAATGYRQFLAAQQRRKAAAAADPRSQLLAAGMGYVDFARENPDMFRLVFSSTRIDHADPELAAAGRAAFDQLVADVFAVTGVDPYRSEAGLIGVSAVWSLVHGAAELLIGGRLPIPADDPAETERLVRDLVARALPLATGAA